MRCVARTARSPGRRAAAASGAPQRRTGRAAPAAVALRTYLQTRDAAARDDLVEHYLPLVIAIARRYEHCGEPLEDLVQVGAIGLIHAIDRFDPERGVQLSSFAIPTIEGEIRRELRDRGGTIRLPRSTQQARTRVLRSRDELAAQLGRTPAAAELAAATGLTAEAVAEALQAGWAIAPQQLADGAGTGAGEPAAVDERLDASEDRVLLAGGFAALDERERRVLHLRYFEGLSQTQIATQVGLSQAHVSRIIRDALAKLRDQLDVPGEDAAISPPPTAISPPSAGPPAGRLASPPSAPTIAPMASPPARSLDEYLDLPYHFAIARDEAAAGDDAWVVRVEELEGCEARGGTPQAALANVRAALEAWIAPALARGRQVPAPRAEATHSGRLLLRMPPTLHAELARAAEREEVSLNQFVSSALAGAVGWRAAAGEEGADQAPRQGRVWTPALIVNTAVVAIAGIVAIVLLVIALNS